ncbi:hypothetical protein [Haliangium sp.]|uniref:hypothetical protein n=1 Tax=Haliangium sp. TaxID=2663208 RepID=UPI003D0B7D22
MAWRSWIGLVVSVALVLLAAPTPAQAADEDEVVGLRLDLLEQEGQLVVKHIDLGTLLFDHGTYEQLERNPLATVVVVRLYVYRDGEAKPVAFRLLTLRIVYDLWGESYEIRVDGVGERQTGRYQALPPAYRAITEIDGLAVADLGAVEIGPHYYLGLVAELNPVSPETLAEVRRWLTRPAGAAPLSRETSFFGSFVSVFVNARLPEAERVVRARSQPFYRVPR